MFTDWTMKLCPPHQRSHLPIQKTTTVHQALKDWVPTKPPMSILVDIVEQGRVPILFSLQQMKNLRMQLDMRLDRVLISCEALGLHCTGDTSIVLTLFDRFGSNS